MGIRLRRFESDQDEIWHDWSSLDRDGYLIFVIVSGWLSWRHFTQKSAAVWWHPLQLSTSAYSS